MALQIRTTDLLLRNLPPPTPAHCTALSQVLEGVIEQQAMSEQDLERRMEAFRLLQSFTAAKFPGM